MNVQSFRCPNGAAMARDGQKIFQIIPIKHRQLPAVIRVCSDGRLLIVLEILCRLISTVEYHGICAAILSKSNARALENLVHIDRALPVQFCKIDPVRDQVSKLHELARVEHCRQPVLGGKLDEAFSLKNNIRLGSGSSASAPLPAIVENARSRSSRLRTSTNSSLMFRFAPASLVSFSISAFVRSVKAVECQRTATWETPGSNCLRIVRRFGTSSSMLSPHNPPP